MRASDWDPICGSHHGQRPKRLQQQAEYMTAPDHSRKRQIPLAPRAPSIQGTQQQLGGTDGVDGATFALIEKAGQIALCEPIVGGHGLLVPLAGLGVVLRGTPSVFEDPTEVVHGEVVASSCRPLVPLAGFGGIPRNTKTALVHHAEIVDGRAAALGYTLLI